MKTKAKMKITKKKKKKDRDPSLLVPIRPRMVGSTFFLTGSLGSFEYLALNCH